MTAIYRATLAAPSPPGRSQARTALLVYASRPECGGNPELGGREARVSRTAAFRSDQQKRRGEAPETLRPRQHERRF